MGTPRNSGDAALIGRVIGDKYEIVKLLGRGAMGQVFLAKHQTLERTVAIKIVQAGDQTDPLLLGRFKSEARAASRLDHPNSVQIIDYGEEDDGQLLYIVMELLKGQDLEQVLKRIGSMAEARAANIMSQVLSALIAAHQNSIIHRDLKPANIMLVKDPRDGTEHVKVCDFGIAKLQDPLGSEDPTGMMTLTKAGAVVGTPSYMSPEQASGKRVDARTDIFSCGVILYRMITGKKPFKADTLMGLLSQVMATDPTPVVQLASMADGRLVEVIERAMQKDPNQRYQSARDMKIAIDNIRSAPDRTVHDSATMSGHSATRQLPSPDSAEASARMMQSGAVHGSQTWSPSGTYAIPPAPRRGLPTLPIVAGIVLVLGIGIGATLMSRDTGDPARLMELVSAGSWGSAESYALENFETFRHDESALGVIRDAIRQRRESGAFRDDFPIRFDPSAVITPGRWRGTMHVTNGKQVHNLTLYLRHINGGTTTGVLEWPEVGLTAKVVGYYHGNQFIIWDYEVDGADHFKRVYELRDKKSFMVGRDGSLHGFEGALRNVLTAQRVE